VSIASEFKEFAMKGSVVDLAVGVIVGTAFGKIVSSLVGDIITPVLGKLIGDVNFTDLVISLGDNHKGAPVVIKYGSFIQTIFDFLVIAFVLFIALRGINKLKKPTPPSADAPPPPPSREEVLLTEIRDALLNKDALPNKDALVDK